MDKPSTVKILKFHAEKCDGGLACEKACSQVHFKSDEGGEKSAIRIIKDGDSYKMHVCNQRGLCIDVCPVGAITRKKMVLYGLIKTFVLVARHVLVFVPLVQ